MWRELRKIPLGETRSYAEIAAAIGQPKAVRAVGTANGDNHVAVLIPCHRVIRSDGTLGGYAGGLDRKRKLLAPKAMHDRRRSCRSRISACRSGRASAQQIRFNGRGRLMGEVQAVRKKPLWRRIVDFPLVAMLIAIGIVFLCLRSRLLHRSDLLPPVPGFSREMKFDLASIPLLLAAYLLIIRRLGEHPRDDYRDAHWLRNLGLGLGTGLLVFSVAVAIAALVGVYRIRARAILRPRPRSDWPCALAAISEETAVPRDPFPLARGVRRQLGSACW